MNTDMLVALAMGYTTAELNGECWVRIKGNGMQFVPSKNLIQAFDVLNHMTNKGHMVRLNIDKHGCVCKVFDACGDCIETVLAETVQLAICHMAIKIL